MHRLVVVAVVASVVAGCSEEKPRSGDATKPAAVPVAKTAPPLANPSSDVGAPAIGQTSALAADITAQAQAQPADLPNELVALFKQLDDLGRNRVKGAKFVTLKFARTDWPDREFTETGWQIEENDRTVTFLKEDLFPWVYKKASATTIPSSWKPLVVELKSVTPADFVAVCKTMSEPEKEPADDMERISRSFDAPGPSHRLLVMHAACKTGRSDLCKQMLAFDPKLVEDMAETRKSVLEDLAWLHYLRGVNLLMFADRKEVLPHLQLASALSPESNFGTDVNDLLAHLERLVADGDKQQAKQIDETGLTDSEKADLYVAQLQDLHCRQWGQPGWIASQLGYVGDKEDENPPSKRLLDMGMSAIPALIKGLQDDTPTRTVYHWRDFHRSRVVWRVSDFAWTLIRGITDREFGNRRVVGFTMSSMQPDERKFFIKEIEQWYADNKDLSPDDRIFSSFSSQDSDDWITAGRYFLEKNDKRAVPPLLEKIPRARHFSQGQLCELVAKFNDQRARPVIADVLKNATEPSDKISSAIALWALGDESGVPIAIDYVKADKQPYGWWDHPVWFLVWSHTPEGIDALRSLVLNGRIERAGEVIGFIEKAITGDGPGPGSDREAVGSVEICGLLAAAMDRDMGNGASINGIRIRIKDSAARSMAVMRQGLPDPSAGRIDLDPRLFNQLEPDEKKRDEQIAALKAWYEQNRDKLTWDSAARKLLVKTAD